MAVGLLVELEAVGVADVAEMAVMDVAVQRRAAFEELAAGQEADFVSRAVDVLHENMVDGTESDGGKSPVPSVKGDEIVARLALHAADDAVGGRAVDVDAVLFVVVEIDVFYDEMVASRDENAVEIASADGDVADGEIPRVAEEEHAEQMSAVADGARGIDFPSRAVDETAVAAAERLDDGVRIVGADTVGGLFPDAAFDEHVMVKSLGRKRMNPAVGGIGVADHDAAATVHHVDDGLRMDGEALSG